MSNFTSFIPRGGLFKPRETSKLTSPRESGSQDHLWKAVKKTVNRADSQTNTIAQLRSEVNQLKAQRLGLSGMYPFKIYQFPKSLRRCKNNDDWRRVKIRAGIVRTDYPHPSVGQSFQDWTAWGSDGTNFSGLGLENPFDDIYNLSFQIPPSDSTAISSTWNEALIPNDGATYDIWFSFIDGTNDPSLIWPYGLFFGTGTPGLPYDGATSLYTGSTAITPVSYIGATDLYNIKIGSCIVSTGGGVPSRLYIYQEVFAHPLYCRDPFKYTVPRFVGPYDSGQEYFVGDLVTLDDTTVSNLGFRYQFVYSPPSSASAYYPSTLMGSMSGISPLTHTPDPWFMLSKSPIQTSGSAPAWTTGAYDASKYYYRSA